MTGRLAKIPEPFRDAYDAALRQGWTVTVTGGGHLAWQNPDGKTAFTPGTPSDIRGVLTALQKLEKNGLALPGRGQQRRAAGDRRDRPSQRGVVRPARPGRGAVFAEAQGLLSGGVPAPRQPRDGRLAGLAALLAEVSVLYSHEQCPECARPGWSHGARSALTEGGCGRRPPIRDRVAK